MLTQAQTKTTVTADEFDAKFVSGNRISTLHGTSNAKVVFAGSQPGAERTTTSDEVIAKFSTSPRRANQIESVEQTGNFHYAEGVRKASAERARYTPQDETIAATGNPRFEDPATGLQVSAETLRFHRRNNTVDAQGSVKTTYAPAKAQAGGGMLAGSEPVHVTAQTATATTNGRATFTGNARLWQGTSIIEAATIDFDRNARTVIASGPAARRVQVNFTQADTAGKQIPVTVTAGKLVYNDAQRKAVFTDSVQAVGADMTMTARQMDVLLKPRGQSASGNGQLDQIIASGNVQLDEKNPVRKGQGERLVYTAERSKFVLSSVAGKTASIFDAEHGKIEADSLTFFSRDDTVQVGSGENSRVVTKTRIKEDSRP